MHTNAIRKSLAVAGVRSGDTLMIHGDAIVAAQLTSITDKERLKALYYEILNYLGDSGTLVVPTFTYSFAKSKSYNVQESPSLIGKFSEEFRLQFPEYRSRQPIFSVTAVGKYQKEFQEVSLDDCFGKKSCFDLLYELNAKLMNLGCDLGLTFTHYVEQCVGVKYRYFKDFGGKLIDGSTVIDATTRYYVGDLKVRYKMNIQGLKEHLLIKKKISLAPFGRFGSYTVNAKEYFQEIKFLLSCDDFAIIEEGNYT